MKRTQRCYPSLSGRTVFSALLSFAQDCKKYVPQVMFTVVDVISEREIEESKEISERLGIPLRIRKYDTRSLHIRRNRIWKLMQEKAIHKGTEVCELSAGGYYAIVAHGLGSNVLRFRDEKRGMEIFRYNGSVSIGEIMNAPEIWGLPTLYLPNRFEKGVLHTSDATYRLPVNEERFGNHLHGFIQKRAYTVKELGTKGNTAFC